MAVWQSEFCIGREREIEGRERERKGGGEREIEERERERERERGACIAGMHAQQENGSGLKGLHGMGALRIDD